MQLSASHVMAAVLCGALVAPSFAAQSAPPTAQATTATIPPDRVEAVREHLDEAEDLVDSLLRWRHVVSWSARGEENAPPPAGPKNTLISVERAHVQKLTGLLDALAAQVPAPAAKAEGPRGDVRAHLEKAQQIARELQPPQADQVSGAANAKGGLVTIDRTSLERLDVELDAMEMLLPRATR